MQCPSSLEFEIRSSGQDLLSAKTEANYSEGLNFNLTLGRTSTSTQMDLL
jgi:hypothetical protein